MQTVRLTMRPLTALGTPFAGDTLFGQLCWTLRHISGNEHLVGLLDGYVSGNPFVVVSDALPCGHVPLPMLPSVFWDASPGEDHKALKKRRWLPVVELGSPLSRWQSLAVADSGLPWGRNLVRPQPHNTISRQTGTTGIGMFAPYALDQIWLPEQSLWDIWLAYDDTRIQLDQLKAAFDFIGRHGYGRDASVGLGKYDLVDTTPVWPRPEYAQVCNAHLTLGPCAPQGLGFDGERSYWRTMTRFGRHGDEAVQRGKPFKKPVLMAEAGSVFWPWTMDPERTWVGQGLGGVDAPISHVMPETVHQGYAAALPILIPDKAMVRQARRGA